MIALLFRIFTVRQRQHVTILVGAAVACVVGGGAVFAATQHRPFTTGLYWAITTATTVGYGDVTPQNAAGRLVASLVMLTTIPLLAGAFAVVTGGAAARGVRRILAMEDRFPQGAYRLVLGTSPMMTTILDELVRAGDPVVWLADVDPAGARPGVHVVRGDPTQSAAIEAARPGGAQQALITGGTDGDVLVSAVLLRQQAPHLEVTALVGSPSVREALHELGVNRTVAAHDLVARTLATSLETPHAGEMVTELVGAGQHRLTEAAADAAAIGKPLSTIRDERSSLVLGLVHEGRFTLGIGDDPVVAAGDYLLAAEPLTAGTRPTREGGRRDG